MGFKFPFRGCAEMGLGFDFHLTVCLILPFG